MSNIRPVSPEVAAEVIAAWQAQQVTMDSQLRPAAPFPVPANRPRRAPAKRRLADPWATSEGDLPPLTYIPRSLPAETIQKIGRLRAYGLSIDELAERFSMDARAVENALMHYRKGARP